MSSAVTSVCDSCAWVLSSITCSTACTTACSIACSIAGTTACSIAGSTACSPTVTALVVVCLSVHLFEVAASSQSRGVSMQRRHRQSCAFYSRLSHVSLTSRQRSTPSCSSCVTWASRMGPSLGEGTLSFLQRHTNIGVSQLMLHWYR